jgi:acetaldehyde dehydrogenase
MAKVKCAIIGSGNIGTDLMIKVLRSARNLELAALVGIDPESEGLARARKLGMATTHDGIEGLKRLPGYADIKIAFDATSAKAHIANARALQADGKLMIDLTPAAIGPFVVPVVNLDKHVQAKNLNLVTCGGQATIPIVHAVRTATDRVAYSEIVSSIASKSAGPGTRANIDEFTATTRKGIEAIGGAERGKAIIILNPAEPPLIMRNTVFCLSRGGSRDAVEASILDMVRRVQSYVPGYRLKQAVQFEVIGENNPVNIPGIGPTAGLKTTVFLEVEGAAHYLPKYAGNLDIMTSAAVATADGVAAALATGKVH